MATFRNFVLHLHEAKRAGRHYDLRIQYPNKNKLASWALPKAEVPKTTKDRFLAVQTFDHDIEWLNKQGEIPQGEYGAGTVKIVQKGQCEIVRWTKDTITFIVRSGKPLNGK